MYEVRVRGGFPAAHQVRYTDGDLEPLHGHNWQVEVVVACQALDAAGMGIDFVEAHRALEECLRELTYTNLNDNPALAGLNPTSENLARWIYDRLVPVIERDGVSIARVDVAEQDRYAASYIPAP
ncbi:MAG: 6-pyruvoyl tetrahydropterin synthase family protein [Nitrospinota bacterium]